MSRSVRRFAVLAAGLALAALTGCQARPDTALSTGDVSVSMQHVDTTTDAMCTDAVAEQRGGRGPRGYIRTVIAELLATRELVDQYRAERGVSVATEETAALNTQISTLQGQGVTDARPLAEALSAPSYFTSTLVYVAAAQSELKGMPVDLTDQALVGTLFQSGAADFQTWLTGRSVSFDPRLRLDGSTVTLSQDQNAVSPLAFGVVDNGSVAISSVAKRSLDVQASFEALDLLTPNQVCGS